MCVYIKWGYGRKTNEDRCLGGIGVDLSGKKTKCSNLKTSWRVVS